ncbi:MAG: LSU ribosomal protein L17p, partial [uncultured Solirubrobacterales bacterium]
APPEDPSQAEPRQRPPQGAAHEPLARDHRPRAHPHHPRQGQGRAPRGREADHPGPARRPPRPSPGHGAARPGQVRGLQAVRGDRAALHRAPGRLHADPQARPAPLGRDRDGPDRAGL